MAIYKADLVALRATVTLSYIPVMTPGLYDTRPLKRVLFDTTRFLGAQNLTQERRDSRQNLYDNRSKEQCFEAIC